MPKRKLMRAGLGVLLAGAVMFALAACGGDEGDSADGGDSGATSNAVTIVLKDNVFVPKEFAVKAGEEVTITLKNEGEAVHNMHILSKGKEGKDFSSAATINPGKEDVFKVKLTKTGTVNFQCDFHIPDMVGKITVKE